MKKITQLFLFFVLGIFSISFISAQEIQRVRIDFETPNGYIRQLLLGFTPDNAATDGFDYGYDGANPDNFPDDLNWLIEDERYVIQGVGAFDVTKTYPLGLFLTNSGDITISLNALENFPEEINVYIYDQDLDTYTQINTADFTAYATSGDYLNRYQIAFQDGTSSGELLSLNDSSLNDIVIRSLKSSNELLIDGLGQHNIKDVTILSVLGQQLLNQKNYGYSQVRIKLNNVESKILMVLIRTDKGSLLKKIAY